MELAGLGRNMFVLISYTSQRVTCMQQMDAQSPRKPRLI